MYKRQDRKPISVPLFQSVANVLAEEMARMNVEMCIRDSLDMGQPLVFGLKNDILLSDMLFLWNNLYISFFSH